MKRNQKGISPMLTLIIISVVIVIAAVFLVTRQAVLPIKIQQTNQNMPVIQNTDGLDTVDSELDSTDLDGFDQELDKLDLETATF